MFTNKKISKNGLDLIKYFESLHDGDLFKIGLQPKMCPAGIWTIGYGHALKDLDGTWLRGIKGFQRLLEIYPEYETITKEEAVQLLNEDCDYFEDRVNSLNLELTQNQFDALVSFSFNVGFGSLKYSTLLKMINGSIYSNENLIRDEFLKWKYADKKVLLGLYLRRKSEAKLFVTGKLKFYV